MVYAGEGLNLDAIQTAIDWFNKEVDQECLILYSEPWPYEEVPGGVIKIETGTCSGTLAGCVSYKTNGPVYGDIRITKGNESNSLLIAHEIAHILTNANNKGHTAVKGVMHNPPNAWALPYNYLVNVDYACKTKKMAPAIAKSLPSESRAD